MRNIPKKIYLQIGDDDLDPSSDFNSLSQVTWCEDMQHESDIEYVASGVATFDPEIISEILTKYQEWEYNLPAARFAQWLDEENDHEKMKARIRKEFIEFLKRKK